MLEGHAPGTGTGRSLAGCKVLVVEDDPVISLDVKDLLQGWGCTVLGPASSAAEAADGADGAGDAAPAPGVRPAELALLASVFVVAACGLVYELAAGALASYLLGDSVLQFSTIIGTYLFAMGVGSWLSRFFERQLVAHFLRIELLVGLVGGLMPALLFAAHSVLPAGATASFRLLLYGLVLILAMRFFPAGLAGAYARLVPLSERDRAPSAREPVLP